MTKIYSMKKNKVSIGVLGLWHLGSVYSAGLAKLGFEVTAFDPDSNVIEKLNKGEAPILEPGLNEIIIENLHKNLLYTNNLKETIHDKDYVFVCLDIPVDDKDRIDLKPFKKIADLIVKYSAPNSTVVICSQIPVGTSRQLQNKLRKKYPKSNVLCWPENLRLGTALEVFFKADRVIVGGDDSETLGRFTNDFGPLGCPFVTVALESAEMTKHALNYYLALNISFASELGDLCELLGADASEVVKALKSDKRVSPNSPINPGLGFAGGTLGRDLQTLRKLSDKHGYKPKLIKSIYSVNQDRIPLLASRIAKLLTSLKNKQIGILGLTYKPNTNTLRRSQSLELAELLKRKGAKLRAFDPAITTTIPSHKFMDICTNPKNFFNKLDCIVLMTPWSEFQTMNYKNFGKLMNQKIIIDAKNYLDASNLKQAGFVYRGIGLK